MGFVGLGVENPNACWVVNKTRRMEHILCIDVLESLNMIGRLISQATALDFSTVAAQNRLH